MDCIYIEKLRVDCRIGIYDFEQKSDQPLLIDVTIYYDNGRAADTDDYAKVIDYALVADDIETLLKNSHFALIETAAERIVGMIFEKYGAEKVLLKINKPKAIEKAAAVGVIVERTRNLVNEP